MHRTYGLGDSLFGLRTNSRKVGAWLDRVLAEHAVTDEQADPYYSIFVGGPAPVGRRFHVLYRETASLARTFDLRAVGEALRSELETYLLAERDDAVHIRASVVERNGVSALFLSDHVAHLRDAGGLAERYLRLGLSSSVAVGLDAAELVPVEPQLVIPGEELDRLGELAQVADGRSGSQTPSQSRRSVDAVCFLGFAPDEPPVRRPSAGQTLYRLAGATKNLDPLGGRALEALRRFLEQTPAYELEAPAARPAVSAVTRFLDGLR